MQPPIKKFRVGILGATGMVGQRYIQLLENHPWFEVTCVAASVRSSGKQYEQTIVDRWHMNTPIPEKIRTLPVLNCMAIEEVQQSCDFVFSALELETKEELQRLEERYASAGMPVVSNASAHRWTGDVPMLIPEINPHHLDILKTQKQTRGWDKGFIVVKPNCSLQSYLAPLFALMQSGFTIHEVMVTTLQAVSGAGYPGVASLDSIDNVVPFIGGEEEKTEKEPLKILDNPPIKISAHCTRVGVSDGHLACVNVRFGEKKPTGEEIIRIWESFRGLPQTLDLPSAPLQPIHYTPLNNRPQPKKDRNIDKAMAVTVGRLRPCSVFDWKFVGLSHNTVRGAAGGGILNAELLVAKGYII